jgi:Rhodopirellula transposase DDE domain
MDSHAYPTGKKVTDDELAALHLLREAFHGEWNYTILPQSLPSSGQLI